MPDEVKEVVESEEKVEIEQQEQPIQFLLSDKQAEILRQHASALNSYYAGIGAQFCEIMENIKQTGAIRENINQLQEDIAKELGMPRADRINWDLDRKIVEIVR